MNGSVVWWAIALGGVLSGCSGKPAGTPSGAQIYSGTCIACHQQDARGVPGVYPSLVGSPLLLGDIGPLARWVIKGQRPSLLPAGRYSTAMANFGWMRPEAAAALFTYLRSNFGNSAPAVDAAAVAKALEE